MSVLSERRCKGTKNFSYMQIKMKKTCSHRIIPSKTNEVIAQSKREKKRWGYVRIETERAGRCFLSAKLGRMQEKNNGREGRSSRSSEAR